MLAKELSWGGSFMFMSRFRFRPVIQVFVWRRNLSPSCGPYIPRGCVTSLGFWRYCIVFILYCFSVQAMSIIDGDICMRKSEEQSICWS